MTIWTKLGNELIRAVVVGVGTYIGKDVYERSKKAALGQDEKSDPALKERLEKTERELETLKTQLAHLKGEPAPAVSKEDQEEAAPHAALEVMDEPPMDDPIDDASER